MSRARKTVAATVTLSLALSLGLILQITPAAGQDGDAVQPGVAPYSSPPTQPRLGAEDQQATDVALTSALQLQPDGAAGMADLHAASREPSFRIAPEMPSLPEAPCLIRSRATAEAAAFVRLRILATCLPDSRVTVHHDGLLFTEMTDPHGALEIVVPALAEHAVFMLTFAGDQMAMAVAHVPDVRLYERAVLQWQGHADFELHAREFGAEYGSAGHVWHGAGLSDAALRAALGGYLVRLGNPDVSAPMVADVYSFRSGIDGAGDRIDLSVEAEVTERNCGRDMEAQTIELQEDARLDTRSIVLSVPACDMIGEHLVLNNVFEDLKIAAR